MTPKLLGKARDSEVLGVIKGRSNKQLCGWKGNLHWSVGTGKSYGACPTFSVTPLGMRHLAGDLILETTQGPGGGRRKRIYLRKQSCVI